MLVLLGEIMNYELSFKICDPNKVEIIDALVAGRKLIEDDSIEIEIKDVIFQLSHVIVKLIERIEKCD